MKRQLAMTFKAFGAALPAILIKKLISRLVKVETVIIYDRAPLTPDAVLQCSRNVVEVICIESSTSAIFKSLCIKFPGNDFVSRLDAGRECYVALCDGSIRGYAWVASGSLRIDEIALEYPLTQQEVFIYDCFVDDEYRGMGIYPSMLEVIQKGYCQRNTPTSRVLIASSSLNRPSIRGIRKAGFVEFERIHYMQWRNWQRWWERPALNPSVSRMAG